MALRFAKLGLREVKLLRSQRPSSRSSSTCRPAHVARDHLSQLARLFREVRKSAVMPFPPDVHYVV